MGKSPQQGVFAGLFGGQAGVAKAPWGVLSLALPPSATRSPSAMEGFESVEVVELPDVSNTHGMGPEPELAWIWKGVPGGLMGANRVFFVLPFLFVPVLFVP